MKTQNNDSVQDQNATCDNNMLASGGVKKKHFLKTINPYFCQVWDLNKKFEFRKNDRNFKIGDIVYLQEYYPLNKYFSGNEIKIKITSLLKDFEGIDKDYCVFSFSVIERILMNVDLQGEVSPA
jgi:ribosomal protein S17